MSTTFQSNVASIACVALGLWAIGCSDDGGADDPATPSDAGTTDTGLSDGGYSDGARETTPGVDADSDATRDAVTADAPDDAANPPWDAEPPDAALPDDAIYVDCGAGSDGNGSLSSPYNNLAAAFANIDGGTPSNPDYIFIKGTCRPCDDLPNGDCSDDYNNPTLSFPASHLYITTWPGEPMAHIDGGTSPTGDVMGGSSWSMQDVTVDGLEINGHMTVRGIKQFTLKNCDVHGGGHLTDGLAEPSDSELLFLEDVEGALIQNNKFYDNDGESSSRTTQVVYFGRSSGDTDMGVVFEYNDFYETPSAPRQSEGLFLKDNADGITVRHNYFHDIRGRALFAANQDGPGINVRIHNNVFERCGNAVLNKAAVEWWIEISGYLTFNNTFVDNEWADFWNRDVDTDWHLFNNVMVNSGSNFIRTGWCGVASSSSAVENSCDYLDYNDYYGTASFVNDQGSYCDTHTTLSDWQTYLADKGITDVDDANSVSDDPALLDLTGHDSSDDFRLTGATPSSVLSGGRGGAFPTYLGAWDPTHIMWVGFCAAGVGACNVCGTQGGCGG